MTDTMLPTLAAMDAALGNALVAQKNKVLAALSIAEDADQLDRVLEMLTLLRPVWEAAGYRYKLVEILDRLVNDAYRRRFEAEESRDHKENARRPAVRCMFQREVDALNATIGAACVMRS